MALKKFATVLATVLFVPSALFFSFSTLIFNEPFTNSLLGRFSGRPGEARLATAELLSYYRGERVLPPQIFSPEEQAHLQDTKRVIGGVQNVTTILLALLLALVLLSDLKFVLRAGCLALIIVSFVAMVFFNQTFGLFHALLFPPGSWIFSQDSLLIQFYPFAFFKAYGFWIFAQATLLSAGLALASLAWHQKTATALQKSLYKA